MSEIKSAYEKAMERFQDVKADKTSLRKKENRDKGKLLCAQVLDNPEIDIVQELSKVKDEEKEWVRDGVGESLLTQIALPTNETSMVRIDVIAKIAMALSSNPAVVEQLIKQYREICQKYMEEQATLLEQMQAQMAQIQQQAGGNQEQIQSMQASLVQTVQKHTKELQDQFQPAIKKVRSNLRQLCAFALER